MQSLIVTTIQSNLYWEDKRSNLDMFEKKILGIGEKTELILLPEMFSTGFSMKPEVLAETMEGETVTWMKRVAREKGAILAGSLIIQEAGQAETVRPGTAVSPFYYNRLVWMLPNGKYGTYDKRHRFAYAGEDRQFSAGSRRLIASVKGWKINLQVCYDLRFPVWARQAPQENGEPEYDVLIYVANWPERRSHAWKTLLQARAIENQCYVIGVNRVGDDGNGIYHSGDSMVVDPMGEVLYTKKDAEDIFTITLNRDYLQSVRDKLPFLRDADDFLIVNTD